MKLGPNCQEVLGSKDTVDVTLPPWKSWKRTWDATRYYEEQSTLQAGGLAVNLKMPNFSSVAIVLASTVIAGVITPIVFRRYWRTEEVFTSPVRSDSQFTRHHQEGPAVYDVNEHDTGDVRPKVTVCRLHESRYAGTKHNADQDTEADTNHDGAGARILGSVTTPNDEQEEATFRIPRDASRGRLFYYNRLTGLSTPESPIMLKDQTPDLEKIALDSSNLIYIIP